jgi:hypothetical protein
MRNGVWCSHVLMRQGGERSFGGVALFCQLKYYPTRAPQQDPGPGRELDDGPVVQLKLIC